jgi:RNA polymerase sigma-70 factor (ECF subfamily)
VQQALLHAHKNLRQYRGTSPEAFAAWLRKILANSLAEVHRQYSRQQRDVALERSLEKAIERSACRLESWLVADESTPGQKVMRQETLLRVAAALAELPEEQRRAVELRHLKGLSLNAISAELRRTEASVAGLLRRGLKKLRELMKARPQGMEESCT